LLNLIKNKKPIDINFNKKIDKSLLFETINIKQGEVKNLEFHQQRVNYAYKFHFKSKPFLLKDYFQNSPKGDFRAKLTYNYKGFVNLEFFSYSPKTIKNIILIEAKNFDYKFKYLDRSFFEYLYKVFDAHEFIITKDGFLTDFTIGNIALQTKNKSWHTPKEPLLFGTTLKRLRKKLIFSKIHYKNLDSFSNIALLNAMVGFKELKDT
jgi:4-amino-4-deoxychorismate lyase